MSGLDILGHITNMLIWAITIANEFKWGLHIGLTDNRRGNWRNTNLNLGIEKMRRGPRTTIHNDTVGLRKHEEYPKKKVNCYCDILLPSLVDTFSYGAVNTKMHTFEWGEQWGMEYLRERYIEKRGYLTKKEWERERERGSPKRACCDKQMKFP